SCGVEAIYFTLGQRLASLGAGAGGDPAIFRPFLDTTTGLPTLEPIDVPGGGLVVQNLTRFWGVETNARHELCRYPCFTLDAIAGLRYLEMVDSLTISEFNGDLARQDRFGARNQYFGTQVGLETELRWGRWFVNSYGKIGVGVDHEVVTIGGETITPDGVFPG